MRLKIFICAVLAIPKSLQGAEVVQIQVHEPIVISLVSTDENSWQSFPSQAVFSSGDRRIELDAYWDGGREWKIRFAAPSVGDWNYTIKSTDPSLNAMTGRVTAIAPSEESLQKNANLRGQIQVSSDGHHFAYADGTPVLLLGDCLLISGLPNSQFEQLLEHRRAEGFNALNVRLCKMGSENEGGEVFKDKNVNGLNAHHFQELDRRMQAAWQRGFITFFMPDFIGFGSYSEADARDLWRYLLARYSAFNVCPILTGEYDNPRRVKSEWKPFEQWNELGEYVNDINERGHRVPFGIHPYVASSGAAFHNHPWLAYNQIQAKVWDHFDTTPMSVLENWKHKPAKPTFYAEGTYENQPWANITGTDFHIRHQTWVALLCGAAAVDYGEHLIKGGDLKGKSLDSLLDAPGAKHAALAVKFLTDREWWKMVPLRESVLIDGAIPPLTERKARTPTAYCLAEPQRRYIIYLMAGLEKNQITVSELGPFAYQARWVDPRTGESKPIGTTTTDSFRIPPRPSPADQDWVLSLERTKP